MREFVCVTAVLVMLGATWLSAATWVHARPCVGRDRARPEVTAKPNEANDPSDRPAVPLPSSVLVPPIRLRDAVFTYEDGTIRRVARSKNPTSLDRLADEEEFTHDVRATFHPHGKQLCASGCAVSNHPTRELTAPIYHALLEQYAREPLDGTSFALESLLYFGRQTRQFLASDGAGPLDGERAAFLCRELGRTHARLSIRVVDEAGDVRASLPPTRVPLDRRHVFEMDVRDVQPLVTSGTVKRVGLNHLWVRL